MYQILLFSEGSDTPFLTISADTLIQVGDEVLRAMKNGYSIRVTKAREVKP